MPVLIEDKAPERVADADLMPRGPVFPSPVDWRDQSFYFLLPDRFSDGQEGQRPLFDRSAPDTYAAGDRRAWMQAGKRFQGGNLKGIKSKLDYLQGLGMTTLWIGPVWKQRIDLETYHGYGIQNFLDIDPRFGTRQQLRDLVDAAHERGMYVLLDIIYNHSGNNWFYASDSGPTSTLPYRFHPPRDMAGWRDANGASSDAIQGLEDGVWPNEFQNPEWYTRAGQIGRWDAESWEQPMHPDAEFRRGDFFDLKDIRLDQGAVLSAAIRVYQYWIALSDCDGFRIDTVKHVSWESSRNFCGAIREYAESIGKENFLLLGEVTGGAAMARNYLEIFGRNIDAVLDIGLPARHIAEVVKGISSPSCFFAQFGGDEGDLLGSHRETGRYHVSILDDHDMVGRGKHRFAAHNPIPAIHAQTAHAVGLQLTTLGMPCVYYGTEQAFDGSESSLDAGIDHGFEDRFIRESMFGGGFGAFGTEGCHFFDLSHPGYMRIAAIARVRNDRGMIGKTLRRGRQYLRETAFLGSAFMFPDKGELIAWSRVLYHQEVLICLNTHGTAGRGAEVTVDAALHPPGCEMRLLYHGDWPEQALIHPPEHQTVLVEDRNGRAVVRIDLPPAGMVILA
ncbi:MAG: alpha-amylase family glycosyl hydrolase [Mariprofundus sp.]